MPKYTLKSYLVGLALSIGTSSGALLAMQLQSRAIDWYALGVVALGCFVASLVKLKEDWDGTERRTDAVTPMVGVADRRKARQAALPVDPDPANDAPRPPINFKG